MRRPSILFTSTKWDELNIRARTIIDLFPLSGIQFKFTGKILMDDGRELQLNGIIVGFEGTKLSVQQQRGVPIPDQSMYFRAEITRSHEDDPQIGWI